MRSQGEREWQERLAGRVGRGTRVEFLIEGLFGFVGVLGERWKAFRRGVGPGPAEGKVAAGRPLTLLGKVSVGPRQAVALLDAQGFKFLVACSADGSLQLEPVVPSSEFEGRSPIRTRSLAGPANGQFRRRGRPMQSIKSIQSIQSIQSIRSIRSIPATRATRAESALW